MKRFLLLIMVFSFPVAVSGKIITTENLLDNSVLEDEELIFTESNVCWEEVGDYYVDYYDPKIKTEIREDILIRTTEDLKAGLTFFTPLSNIEISGLKPKGFLPYGKGFFIYGAIYTGYLPYQTMDNYLFCYLAYFENGIMLWEEIFHPERYGSFNDACLTENGIALIGTYDSLSQGKNIIVYEVTPEKNITFQKEIQGSNDDFGLNIFYNRNHFYLVGLTMSDDIDFRYSESRDVFIGKLAKDKSLSVFPLLKENRDELHDAYYNDGKFYLVVENNLNDEKSMELIVIDENNETQTFDLNRYGSNFYYRLSVLQDKIIITFLKDSQTLAVLTVDQNLNLKKESEITFERTITDCFLFQGLETYFVFVSGKANAKTLLLARLNTTGNPEIFFEKEMNTLDKIVGISQNLTGDINLCLEVDSGKFDTYDLKYFRLEESLNETKNYTLKARNILYNGKSLKKEYVSDNIPENPYGKFQTLYRFVQEDFCFYLADEHYYDVKTNIISGEVYDLGVRVYFNGRAFLNGKEITSGSKIDQVGHYLLEIKSADEESQAYIFEVRELSEIEKEIVENMKPEIGDLTVKMLPEGDYPLAEINLKENQAHSNFLLPSLFIGIAIGTLSGFLLPKIKLRRRRNV